MSGMQFTAHNIRLPDGTLTAPPHPLVEERGKFLAPVRMLNLVFPDGLEGRSIVDLGCLEGGFTTGFARLGMEATGIEIRDSNLENCRYVQSKMDLPNLRFIKDDVNNIDKYGPFDAVFAAGIFYHLDRPLAFLQKAATVCRKIIFLETQYTYAERTPPCDRHSLSDLCENEGVMGRWYPEHDEAPGTKLETLKWASWENRRSFWIQREYLLDAINRVGFDIVLEQHDIHSGDIVSGIKRGREEEGDRGMFIGIRRGPDSGTSWRKSWWSSRFGRRHKSRNS